MVTKRKGGPLGDIAPPKTDPVEEVTPSIPPEPVEDRENVGIVQPEDYPEAERELTTLLTDPKNERAKSKPGREAGIRDASGPGQYDQDAQGGEGQIRQKPEREAPDTKGDAPIHGSR